MFRPFIFTLVLSTVLGSTTCTNCNGFDYCRTFDNSELATSPISGANCFATNGGGTWASPGSASGSFDSTNNDGFTISFGTLPASQFSTDRSCTGFVQSSSRSCTDTCSQTNSVAISSGRQPAMRITCTNLAQQCDFEVSSFIRNCANNAPTTTTSTTTTAGCASSQCTQCPPSIVNGNRYYCPGTDCGVVSINGNTVSCTCGGLGNCADYRNDPTCGGCRVTATTTTLSPTTTTTTTGASGTTTSSSPSTTSPSCTSCATGGDCSQECTASCGSAGVSSFTCNKVGNIIQKACICNSASSSNPCFHEDTVITYGGVQLTLQDLQSRQDCRIPHIVQAQGVIVTAQCGDSQKHLRLTDGHLVYTQRGLQPAASITTKDTVYADIGETVECRVVSVTKEQKTHKYFGLNCYTSQVLADGLKTSTFEKLHSVPSFWMAVVGRVLGIKHASAIGDHIAELVAKLNLV